MFWSVLAIVYGLAVAIFPRKAIDYTTRILLACYENPEELRPSPWLVSVARIEGVLFALAGIVTIAIDRLETRRE